MSMIECPECGKEVSDNAVMCPNCGYGVKEHFSKIESEEVRKQNEEKRKKQHERTIKKLKIIIPISVFILAISITILWFLTSYNGKFHNHCGIYDTKSQKYIDLGDNRANIEKIIGNGTKDSNNLYYVYADNLKIRYDEHDNAVYIYVNFFSFNGDLNRYTLFDECGNKSNASDFAKKHSHVYQSSLDTVIFLKKSFWGYKEITKQEIQSSGEKNIKDSNNYIRVSFDTLGVSVNYIHPDYYTFTTEWDKYTEFQN